MSSARIRLRVAPGARRTELVGRYGDAWRVRVAAPPQAGRANAELVAYLAELLDVPAADVRLVGGRALRDKLVEISGVDEAALTARLESSSR